MATEEEKTKFTDSLQAVIDACHLKTNDGGLTQVQQQIFYRHGLLFNSSQDSALVKDFGPIDSVAVADAIKKNNTAAQKTNAAENSATVSAADNALAEAQAANDKVLV